MIYFSMQYLTYVCHFSQQGNGIISNSERVSKLIKMLSDIYQNKTIKSKAH